MADQTAPSPAKKARTRKPRLFHKILELAKEKGGRVEVTDPALSDIMTQNGKDTMYRLPTQMSGIRRVEKIEVVAIRKGKKVIAYDFPVYAALDASGRRPSEVEADLNAPAAPDATPEVDDSGSTPNDVVEADAAASVTV